MNEIDLTPSDSSDHGSSRSLSSLRNWLIGLSFLLLIGFFLYKALDQASVYFLNVDEAIEEKQALSSKTFRMQGQVLTQPKSSDDFKFFIGYGGEQALVDHVGDEPSDLFECGQNVVVEGNWAGDYFVSKQIFVKHSEDYLEDNPDRISDQEGANSKKCLENSEISEDLLEVSNSL